MADNRRGSFVAVGLALVSGGLLGAAMALLLAPKSGRQAREQLRGYARRAEENVHELADTATRALDQAMDTGHKFLKDKQAALSEAVEAGRVAIQGERERVSSGEKG
jgi:gas vesicle protein